MTLGIVLLNIGVILTFFICTTFSGILVSYMFALNSTLDNANQEHIRLLNGMHEGLLILSNVPESKDRSVLFCNQNASKLMKTFIGNLHDPKEQFCSMAGFAPVKLSAGLLGNVKVQNSGTDLNSNMFKSRIETPIDLSHIIMV